MRNRILTALAPAATAALICVCAPERAFAQGPPAAAQPPIPPGVLTKTVCGTELRAPEHIRATPPPGATFIWQWEMCFPSQGNVSAIEPETYVYYVKFSNLVSRPSEGIWSAWDERARDVLVADFNTLMRSTTFLDDLRVEVNDYTFPNGAVGRIVSFIGEERERIKIVDYRDGKGDPIKIIKRSDIDDRLREKEIQMRLDSFVDTAAKRRVGGVLNELMYV